MNIVKNGLGLSFLALLTLVMPEFFGNGEHAATANPIIAQSLPGSESPTSQPENSPPEQPILSNTSNFDNPWQEEENSVQQQNEQENSNLQQEFSPPDNNVEEPGLPAPDSNNSQSDDTSIPLQ